jgi:hypothetical protein
MERERLDSAAVEAVLTAIARYPERRPEKLFPWLKNTIGFRLLGLGRQEVSGTCPRRGAAGAEQIAVANTLDDLLELVKVSLARRLNHGRLASGLRGDRRRQRAHQGRARVPALPLQPQRPLADVASCRSHQPLRAPSPPAEGPDQRPARFPHPDRGRCRPAVRVAVPAHRRQRETWALSAVSGGQGATTEASSNMHSPQVLPIHAAARSDTDQIQRRDRQPGSAIKRA